MARTEMHLAVHSKSVSHLRRSQCDGYSSGQGLLDVVVDLNARNKWSHMILHATTKVYIYIYIYIAIDPCCYAQTLQCIAVDDVTKIKRRKSQSALQGQRLCAVADIYTYTYTYTYIYIYIYVYISTCFASPATVP